MIIRFNLAVDEGHNLQTACNKLLYCSAVNYFTDFDAILLTVSVQASHLKSFGLLTSLVQLN